MATVKEATLNAMAFARETLGEARTEGLLLEEIESTIEDGRGRLESHFEHAGQ